MNQQQGSPGERSDSKAGSSPSRPPKPRGPRKHSGRRRFSNRNKNNPKHTRRQGSDGDEKTPKDQNTAHQSASGAGRQSRGQREEHGEKKTFKKRGQFHQRNKRNFRRGKRPFKPRGGDQPQFKVTATELACLLNQPLNHVVAVCILQMIRQNLLRNVSNSPRTLQLKSTKSPYLRYQRILADYFRKPKNIREPIPYNVVQPFLKEIFQKLDRLELVNKKGFFRKKWRPTNKGKDIIERNKKWLKEISSLHQGLSFNVVRAYAMDYHLSHYISGLWKSVCYVKVHSKTSFKDWFHATLAAQGRSSQSRNSMEHG